MIERIDNGNKKYDVHLGKGSYTALGYRSATVANREGRSSTAASGQAHMQYHRSQLQNQSREFVRDNPIYKGMIERAAGYIVGNGFGLQSKAADPETRSLIEKRWKNFWKRPEIKNINSGRECEKMICKELLTVGDSGTLKTSKKKIQIFESEQITNGIYGDDGIDKDTYGTPTMFHVGGYGKFGNIGRRTIKAIKPENFLFLTETERPSAIRGMPPCQASFPMLHRINDVCDSEAIAWQLLARLAISVTREKGKELGYINSKQDPDKTNDELAVRLTELDYALIFHGNIGDEIKGIERNLPGRNFSESLIMFLRLLGLPLGLPLEVILLDWTKSNYSQSRAVLEQAFTTFLGWQYKLADFFLSPIFEWQLQNDISDGVYDKFSQEGIFEHDWIKPTFPWIDQLKEALAWGQKLDRGLTLHSKALKSLGAEREDEMNEREAEVSDAIKRAARIEKNTKVKVPWQIFCGLEPPGGATKVFDMSTYEGGKDKKKKDKEEQND